VGYGKPQVRALWVAKHDVAAGTQSSLKTAWPQFANSLKEDYSGPEDIWYKIDVDATYQVPNRQQRIRLASDIGLAPDGGGLPRSAVALGIHVDSFALDLRQPEVTDIVEIANYESRGAHE
jgi:hypothetical protein